jgi:hypothetical protein
MPARRQAKTLYVIIRKITLRGRSVSLNISNASKLGL